MTDAPEPMQDPTAHHETSMEQPMTIGLDDLSQETRNVLVLAPTHGGHWHQACQYFHTRRDLADTNLLILTYVVGASNYATRLSTDEMTPAGMAIVEATGETTPANVDSDFPLEIRREAPGDLTGIGIQCSEFLTRWHDTPDVSLCLESITSMLQYVPIQTAYRFLHVLTHRVAHANATAHYHMSPDAHSQKEVGTIKQLFDAVATYDEDTQTWDVVER